MGAGHCAYNGTDGGQQCRLPNEAPQTWHVAQTPWELSDGKCMEKQQKSIYQKSVNIASLHLSTTSPHLHKQMRAPPGSPPAEFLPWKSQFPVHSGSFGLILDRSIWLSGCKAKTIENGSLIDARSVEYTLWDINRKTGNSKHSLFSGHYLLEPT